MIGICKQFNITDFLLPIYGVFCFALTFIIFKLRSMNTKYYFWDDGNGLHGHDNVTLKLAWNVIPNAGNLPRIQSTGSHSFKFPKEYTTARVI